MSVFRILQTNHLLRMAQRITQLRSVSIHQSLLLCKTERSFSSNPDIEQIVVPNLGDSITEGTVTAIHKQIGEKVATDDVVLEIETDKVSVDIRAPKEGYIAQYFAAMDQDVAVGGALYALSVQPIDGVDPSSIVPQPSAQIETPSSAPPASPSSQKPIAEPSPPTTSTHRVPMIKFRYGAREDIDKVINGISTPQVTRLQPLNENTIPFWELPQELRRTEFKEQDIDAVNTGGASLTEMRKSNFD